MSKRPKIHIRTQKNKNPEADALKKAYQILNSNDDDHYSFSSLLELITADLTEIITPREIEDCPESPHSQTRRQSLPETLNNKESLLDVAAKKKKWRCYLYLLGCGHKVASKDTHQTIQGNIEKIFQALTKLIPKLISCGKSRYAINILIKLNSYFLISSLNEHEKITTFEEIKPSNKQLKNNEVHHSQAQATADETLKNFYEIVAALSNYNLNQLFVTQDQHKSMDHLIDSIVSQLNKLELEESKKNNAPQESIDKKAEHPTTITAETKEKKGVKKNPSKPSPSQLLTRFQKIQQLVESSNFTDHKKRIREEGHQTPLGNAISKSDLNAIINILKTNKYTVNQKCPRLNIYPLAQALYSGQFEIAFELINKGANVDDFIADLKILINQPENKIQKKLKELFLNHQKNEKSIFQRLLIKKQENLIDNKYLNPMIEFCIKLVDNQYPQFVQFSKKEQEEISKFQDYQKNKPNINSLIKSESFNQSESDEESSEISLSPTLITFQKLIIKSKNSNIHKKFNTLTILFSKMPDGVQDPECLKEKIVTAQIINELYLDLQEEHTVKYCNQFFNTLSIPSDDDNTLAQCLKHQQTVHNQQVKYNEYNRQSASFLSSSPPLDTLLTYHEKLIPSHDFINDFFKNKTNHSLIEGSIDLNSHIPDQSLMKVLFCSLRKYGFNDEAKVQNFINDFEQGNFVPYFARIASLKLSKEDQFFFYCELLPKICFFKNSAESQSSPKSKSDEKQKPKLEIKEIKEIKEKKSIEQLTETTNNKDYWTKLPAGLANVVNTADALFSNFMAKYQSVNKNPNDHGRKRVDQLKIHFKKEDKTPHHAELKYHSTVSASISSETKEDCESENKLIGSFSFFDSELVKTNPTPANTLYDHKAFVHKALTMTYFIIHGRVKGVSGESTHARKILMEQLGLNFTKSELESRLVFEKVYKKITFKLKFLTLMKPLEDIFTERKNENHINDLENWLKKTSNQYSELIDHLISEDPTTRSPPPYTYQTHCEWLRINAAKFLLEIGKFQTILTAIDSQNTDQLKYKANFWKLSMLEGLYESAWAKCKPELKAKSKQLYEIFPKNQSIEAQINTLNNPITFLSNLDPVPQGCCSRWSFFSTPKKLLSDEMNKQILKILGQSNLTREAMTSLTDIIKKPNNKNDIQQVLEAIL